MNGESQHDASVEDESLVTRERTHGSRVCCSDGVTEKYDPEEE